MNKISLVSDRLLLRLVEPNDLEAIHALHLLPETDQYNVLGIPANLEETSALLEFWVMENQRPEIQQYRFVVELLSSGEFIGLIGLNLKEKKYRGGEVWYKLHVKHWGKGYATEALNRVLDFGFDDLKLHRIQAGAATDNIASIKVLEKVGMTREGIGRKILPLKSGWSDNYAYSILADDARRH